MDEDDITSGRAVAVAPLYQPIMWLKAEIAPLTVTVVLVGAFALFVEQWWLRIAFFLVGIVVWVILQRVGELDNRFFSTPMGFKDRTEWIATGNVSEYEREQAGRKWIFF